MRDWLEAQGVRSKAWVTRKGLQVGGAVFSRGALFHLLKSRTYLGEIVHKDRSYPGSHAPIIDTETFDAVHIRLASLLFDLRVIASERGSEADFKRRLRAIRERHARKERFIERLEALE